MNPAPDRQRYLLDGLLIVGLCALAAIIQAPGLAHPFMPNWDESMHQAATRGTYDSFLRPHLYVDPLQEATPADMAFRGGVWLHMPTGPIWLGALMMHLIGVTPLALRLVSLLADILAAVCLLLYVRPVVGKWFGLIGPVVYLLLPFLWKLTQGWQFGDVSDTTLAAGNMLAMVLLLKTVETPSLRWASGAGAAIGATFLCKSGLGLAPLGVAGALAVLGTTHFCKGLRWRDLVALTGSATFVAAPWNLYSAWRYPEIFKVENAHALGHFSASTTDLRMWNRPFDAVFNEVHRSEVSPFSVALPLIVFAWLLVRSVLKREPRVIALVLWMTGGWFVLSLVSAKAPGLAWGVIPAFMVGIAIMVRDAVGSWPLALAFIGPFVTVPAIRIVPALARLRELVPLSLPETRSQSGLVEGLCLATVGGVAGALLTLLARAVRLPRSVSVIATAILLLITAALFDHERNTMDKAQRLEFARQEFGSAASELGPVLARTLPKNALLDAEVGNEPRNTFLHLDLMFWSGFMAYVNPSTPLLRKGRDRGYHPYLVSAAAEPYAPIGGIPPQSWLRAYDLELPESMPAPPPGLEPLPDAGPVKVLGVASGAVDATHDRYAFYVTATMWNPASLRITFHSKNGDIVEARPEAILARPEAVRTGPWFILPVLGPPRASVERISLGT